jgi:hypothetical protein
MLTLVVWLQHFPFAKNEKNATFALLDHNMLVSRVEVAFLVLSWLKEEKLKATYECLLKEYPELSTKTFPVSL